MTSYIHGWLKLKPHQRSKNVNIHSLSPPPSSTSPSIYNKEKVFEDYINKLQYVCVKVTNWDLFEDLNNQLLKCKFEVHWVRSSHSHYYYYYYYIMFICEGYDEGG